MRGIGTIVTIGRLIAGCGKNMVCCEGRGGEDSKAWWHLSCVMDEVHDVVVFEWMGEMMCISASHTEVCDGAGITGK